jgi:hypothetical protein
VRCRQRAKLASQRAAARAAAVVEVELDPGLMPDA